MTTTYRVIYSRGHASNEIGQRHAARSRGGGSQGWRGGHGPAERARISLCRSRPEGDDDYGIWIEWPQTYEWK